MNQAPVIRSLKAPAARIAVVTGGAGFLGSHLCARLLDDGRQVICMDNFFTGRYENVAPLIDRPGFSVVEHDVVDPFPASIPQATEIYNLACPASPPRYQADPVKTALICSQGTYNVLLRAKRDGARLFHASTSEVYGDPDVHPQSEDYHGNVNPVGPRSCYDEGKRFSETLIRDFSLQKNLEARVVRIFNTYGPNMDPDDGRVVSNFIVQALQGRDLTVYGSGAQTRSFCYVDDLIEGFVRLMASDVSEPVNLGNPGEFTVRELAETIITMVGSKSRIIEKPLPEDDPKRRRPDITRAEEKLEWRPTVNLKQGLMNTIGYFDAILKRPAAVAAG